MGRAPAFTEARALRAMRAWRRGVGPLEPWFRATPFAAARHYRGRLPRSRPRGAIPAPVARFLGALPAPAARTLWIFDLPGPEALWLAWGLRRRFGMASALAWNGWYDPRGALDGAREIPLLVALGRRLERLPARGPVAIVFDSARHGEKPPGALDNRYVLGDEDAPGLEHLARMGIRRVRAWIWGAPGEDISAYLAYLRTRLPVVVTAGVGARG